MEKINAGHYFEIMDRVFIIQENLSAHVRYHPACTEEWKKKIDEAQDILSTVRSEAGGKFDEMTEDKT